MRFPGSWLNLAIAVLSIVTLSCANRSPLARPAGGRANTPPVATILSPALGSSFVSGDNITLSGDATDRETSAKKLLYQWDVHHLQKQLIRARLFSGAGKNASFVANVEPSDGASLRIRLMVTDAGKLTDTVTVHIRTKSEQPAAAAVIGAGDILQVSIYAGGEKQEEFSAEVSPAGSITSPLIGDITVGGSTTSQAAGKMTTILARDFFVDPQVLVSVKEFVGKVYISGEVKHPGAYDIKEGLRVLNACILAGGFTDFASLGRVKVIRSEDGRIKTLEIDLGRVQRGKMEDLVLQPGDRIDVPHRRF
jgi:polysaccharide export outer membrane protein